jgi:hypothetical protein
MIGLVAPHCLASLIVPAPIRLCFQVACLGQSLLDFLNAFRLRTQLSSPPPRRRRLFGLGGNMLCRRVVRGVVLAGLS